ncbi:MAG: FAD-dependent oxidoreductase [Planctomycetota bacterium]
MPMSSRAIVIGGGVIGLCSGWELQQRGWKVTVLERDTVGSGASIGNCGYVCPSHAPPLSGPGVIASTLPQLFRRNGALSIPLRWDPSLWGWLWSFARHCNAAAMQRALHGRAALLNSSMQIYRDWIAKDQDDLQWQSNGLLLVFRSDQSYRDYARTADVIRDAAGVPVTEHPGSDICEIDQSLRDDLAGGWFFPQDAHLHPAKLIASLRRRLEAGGGEIREGVSVDRFEVQAHEASAVTTTRNERISGDLFVLATGAEMPQIARQLGCRVPIVPGKGFSMMLPEPSTKPTVPMIFEESHVAITPLADGLRVGSTMQLTGYDRTIPPRRLRYLRDSAQAHLACSLSASEFRQPWTGWRPMMPDGLPCIDRTPTTTNVILASGNGMIGISTAPATGRLVAELASDQAPHIDATAYRLSRFS